MRRVVLACCLVACGADDGGTTRRSDCEVDIVVSGGYDWKSAETNGQIGCGSTGGSTGVQIGVELYGPGDNDFHGVSVGFDPPIMMAQTGDVPVLVEVEIDDDSISRAVWRTSAGACTFKIVKNEFTADDFFTNKYVIGGTVTCAGEIPPLPPDTTLPAITVNAFKFQSFVDYD